MNKNRPLPKLAPLARAILRAQNHYSQKVVVRFGNMPSRAASILAFLSESALCEGRTRELSGGYTTRLDRRPPNQGGDQLHIQGPQGQKWAYRYNGTRSEPNKYVLSTTNRVRAIVSQEFGIDKSIIEEVTVLSANAQRILVEVTFT
jgi:hypothetical protein